MSLYLWYWYVGMIVYVGLQANLSDVTSTRWASKTFYALQGLHTTDLQILYLGL
jgi:hypothetical protein